MKLHSICDIITNSSSVEYVCASEDSVRAIKEFVNEVLKAAGSDKTADDVVDIRVVPDADHSRDTLLYFIDEVVRPAPEGLYKMSTDELMEFARNLDWDNEDNEWDYESYEDLIANLAHESELNIDLTDVKITAKDGTVLRDIKNIYDVYSTWG